MKTEAGRVFDNLLERASELVELAEKVQCVTSEEEYYTAIAAFGYTANDLSMRA